MTIYYVDASATDTTGDGSVGDPFKRIQDGINVAVAGDTVEVASGTYYEKITCSTSGTSGSPITIEAATEHGAILDGGYTSLDGDIPNWTSSSVLPDTEHEGMITIGADYIVIDGLKVQNCAGRALFAYEAASSSFKNCYVDGAYSAGFVVLNSDDITFDGCTIEEVGLQRLAYLRDPAGIGDWTGASVVAPSPRTNTSSAPTGITFTDCTWKNTYGEGLIFQWGTSDCTVEDCLFYNSGSTGPYIVWSQDITIRNNVIWRNRDDPGRGSEAGIIVNDERQYDKHGFAQSSGGEIYGNLIIGCGNVHPERGWRSGGIDLTEGANLVDFYIAYNTVVNCTTYGIRAPGPETGRTWRNNIIENNIFQEPDNDTSTSGIVWRNNNWTTRTAAGVAASPTTDVYGDPALVDDDAAVVFAIDTTDYDLTNASPGIGEARDTGIVTTDYYGASRGASPDMGFMQYDGDVSPTVAASFTASDTTPDAGITVTLTDTSTITVGSLDTWLWQVSLDSGQTKSTVATTQNTTYQPAAVGSYTIYLTTTDTDTGEDDTTSKVLTVGAPIVDPENPPDADDDTFSCANNLLSNPSFDTDTTSWASSGIGISRVVDPTDGDNYVLRAATWSASSDEVRQSGFAITSGETYQISFDAWTTTGSVATVMQIIQHGSPYAHLVEAQNITLTTEKTRFRFELTATATEASSRFRLRIPYLGTGEYIYLDDVCIRVYDPITASFSLSDSTPAVGNTVTLTDTSTGGNPHAWTWRINGQLLSRAAGPISWEVESEGEYTVTLTVAGPDDTDTATETATTSNWEDRIQRGIRRNIRRGLG